MAVKFRHQRLATGRGHSIQEAEMNAASAALQSSHGKKFFLSFSPNFLFLYLNKILMSPSFSELFPQLNHQKRIIERSLRKQDVPNTSGSSSSGNRRKREGSSSSISETDS